MHVVDATSGLAAAGLQVHANVKKMPSAKSDIAERWRQTI